MLILLAALYTVIYGVLLPFFRWGEQFAVVRTILTVIPTAVVAVLLFMVGRHILQKEQDRKEAQAEEWDEETWDDVPYAEEIFDEELFREEPVEMTGEILAEIGVETAEWAAQEAEAEEIVEAEEAVEAEEIVEVEKVVEAEEILDEESAEVEAAGFQGIDIEPDEAAEESAQEEAEKE